MGGKEASALDILDHMVEERVSDGVAVEG